MLPINDPLHLIIFPISGHIIDPTSYNTLSMERLVKTLISFLWHYLSWSMITPIFKKSGHKVLEKKRVC